MIKFAEDYDENLMSLPVVTFKGLPSRWRQFDLGLKHFMFYTLTQFASDLRVSLSLSCIIHESGRGRGEEADNGIRGEVRDGLVAMDICHHG